MNAPREALALVACSSSRTRLDRVTSIVVHVSVPDSSNLTEQLSRMREKLNVDIADRCASQEVCACQCSGDGRVSIVSGKSRYRLDSEVRSVGKRRRVP